MPACDLVDNTYDVLMLAISLLTFHAVMYGARRMKSWLLGAEIMPCALFVVHYAFLAFNVAWYECNADLQRQIVRPALLFLLLLGAVVLIDGRLTDGLDGLRLRLINVWFGLFKRSSAS